jgi:CubicO group peptidase (beta-lactamase class C family)
MKNALFAFAVAAILISQTNSAYTQTPAAQAAVGVESSVDKVFAKWTTATPGCAVGVAVDGKPVLAKAYGMADLEHDVKNAADTIFEAGSVSKQFTAAAVLLLAKEGKLSLDDQARKYIPELPDYGTPLTIRHMLHHQSGLRDWGSVEGIAGWPRTTREYTHDHVLDIVSRQKALNFKPGTQYSYSNTGFNLAAIIVSRVSGMPFADFTQQRIFAPLGMTHTSWRDDHTRIVKGRAIAYSAGSGGFHTEMPFENVHGNGGLLTTVGDLLKWNENFDQPIVGDAALVAQQQEAGKFADGHAGSYAFGLMVGDYRGLRKVDHSGSTAGYRAHLSRFPDAHTSVAVLCNVSNGNATGSADAVADLYLAGKLKPAPPPIEPDFQPSAILLTPTELNEYAGGYWSDEAEVMFNLAVEKDQLVIKRRPATTIELTNIGKDVFRGSIGTVTFMRDASGHLKEFSIRQERVFDLRFQKRP